MLTCTMENAVKAMHEAAKKGDLVTVRRQLEAGVEVGAAENGKGYTALMWAAQNGHLPIVKLLHGRGADVNAKRQRLTSSLRLGWPPRHRKVPRGESWSRQGREGYGKHRGGRAMHITQWSGLSTRKGPRRRERSCYRR